MKYFYQAPIPQQISETGNIKQNIHYPEELPWCLHMRGMQCSPIC